MSKSYQRTKTEHALIRVPAILCAAIAIGTLAWRSDSPYHIDNLMGAQWSSSAFSVIAAIYCWFSGPRWQAMFFATISCWCMAFGVFAFYFTQFNQYDLFAVMIFFAPGVYVIFTSLLWYAASCDFPESLCEAPATLYWSADMSRLERRQCSEVFKYAVLTLGFAVCAVTVILIPPLPAAVVPSGIATILSCGSLPVIVVTGILENEPADRAFVVMSVGTAACYGLITAYTAGYYAIVSPLSYTCYWTIAAFAALDTFTARSTALTRKKDATELQPVTEMPITISTEEV